MTCSRSFLALALLSFSGLSLMAAVPMVGAAIGSPCWLQTLTDPDNLNTTDCVTACTLPNTCDPIINTSVFPGCDLYTCGCAGATYPCTATGGQTSVQCYHGVKECSSGVQIAVCYDCGCDGTWGKVCDGEWAGDDENQQWVCSCIDKVAPPI